MFDFPRQYLEYEGIGFGSPSTRQKQYQNYRVQRASDKVIDHKTRQFGDQETSIAEPEKRAIRRSKYSKVIDRLVEDLIQEAMSKGEFKNLSGSGKPLKLEQELYVGRCDVCLLKFKFRGCAISLFHSHTSSKEKIGWRWCNLLVGEGC